MEVCLRPFQQFVSIIKPGILSLVMIIRRSIDEFKFRNRCWELYLYAYICYMSTERIKLSFYSECQLRQEYMHAAYLHQISLN